MSFCSPGGGQGQGILPASKPSGRITPAYNYPFAEILKARGTPKRRFYSLFPALAVIAYPKHYLGFSERVAGSIEIGADKMELTATALAKGPKPLVTQNPARHGGREGQLELRFLVHSVKI